MDFRPKIAVSRCLGFEACRYNGQIYNNNFINNLKNYVDFITLCPETEIGLGIPRDPIRIVVQDGRVMLYESSTEKDYYTLMNNYIEKQLIRLKDMDGFILKGKSPSCAIRDAKIYQGTSKSAQSSKGKGVFGGAVNDNFGWLAVEDDGRLKNYKIREHFLTKLFILSDFKTIKISGSINKLIDFHKKNRLLLISYNKKEYNNMNKIIKNLAEQNISEDIEDYEKCLANAFSKIARYTSNVSVMLSMLDEFSRFIRTKEIDFINNTIQRYRLNRVPISVPLNVINSYAIRFDIQDLISQTIFHPFPEELIELADSGKGRI